MTALYGRPTRPRCVAVADRARSARPEVTGAAAPGRRERSPSRRVHGVGRVPVQRRGGERRRPRDQRRRRDRTGPRCPTSATSSCSAPTRRCRWRASATRRRSRPRPTTPRDLAVHDRQPDARQRDLRGGGARLLPQRRAATARSRRSRGSGASCYLPQLPVGRLVETPLDIKRAARPVRRRERRRSLRQTALTTGYDFLTDGAEATGSALAALVGPANATRADLPTRGRSSDLASRFTGKTPPDRHPLGQRALQPLAAAARGAATAVRRLSTADVPAPAARTRRSRDRIIFTMGCHGGLNVAEHAPARRAGAAAGDRLGRELRRARGPPSTSRTPASATATRTSNALSERLMSTLRGQAEPGEADRRALGNDARTTTSPAPAPTASTTRRCCSRGDALRAAVLADRGRDRAAGADAAAPSSPTRSAGLNVARDDGGADADRAHDRPTAASGTSPSRTGRRPLPADPAAVRARRHRAGRDRARDRDHVARRRTTSQGVDPVLATRRST